ncbi:hypothetical protein SprV_0100495100 [Sparganum proliferum]
MSDMLNSREIRQLDYISQFTSDIRYIAGSSNEVADALSRLSIAHIQPSPTIDLTEMAAEQRHVGSHCDEDVSGPKLQNMLLTVANGTIPFDVSPPPPSLCTAIPPPQGQTGRTLGPCIRENKLAVRRGDKFSQVAVHIYKSDYKFNTAATKIIAHTGNKTGGELAEAWASGENSADQFIDLAPAYRNLHSNHHSCTIDR